MWKKEKKINTTWRWCKLWIRIPFCETPICHLPPCHTARYRNIMRTPVWHDIHYQWSPYPGYQFPVTKMLRNTTSIGLLKKHNMWVMWVLRVEQRWGRLFRCYGMSQCVTPIRPKWRWCYGMCQCNTPHKTKMTLVLWDVQMHHTP